MKFSSVYASLLVASLSAVSLAEISFDPLPLRLYAGDSCELRWTADRDYVSMTEVPRKRQTYGLVLIVMIVGLGAFTSPTLR